LAHAAGGRLKRAERAAARARELIGKVPGKRHTALLSYVDGLVAAARGERARAARQFRKAIDALTATDALAAAKARADFGAYLAAAGEMQRAQPLLAAAARCFDGLGNKKRAGSLRAMTGKSSVRAGRKK